MKDNCKCGEPKMDGYDLCYKCHMEKKAEQEVYDWFKMDCPEVIDKRKG